MRSGAHPAFVTIVSVEVRRRPGESLRGAARLVSGDEAERALNEAPALVLARITGARKGAIVDG